MRRCTAFGGLSSSVGPALCPWNVCTVFPYDNFSGIKILSQHLCRHILETIGIGTYCMVYNLEENISEKLYCELKNDLKSLYMTYRVVVIIPYWSFVNRKVNNNIFREISFVWIFVFIKYYVNNFSHWSVK